MTMHTVLVKLKNRTYPVVVGSGILAKLPGAVRKLSIGADAVIITNPVVRKLYGARLAAAFVKAGFSVKVLEVPDSERSKSMATAMGLIGAITRYAADKKPFIVALGGGVIGDLAGFVASVYKRGIPLVQVPTTLLAQVDSAIGGKVAVDLPEGKNLVGSFYQPRLVWSDVALLASLPEREVHSGLAEVVKYGVIADAALFAFLEKNVEALLERDEEVFTRVVLDCAGIKARVVGLDEKETKGLRTVLNFGHTVGHALESACGYKGYNHGEAVALGMRAAVRMSMAGGLLSARDAMRVEMLLSCIGLPQRIRGASPEKILKGMRFDKKFSGKKNRFVLAKGIGRAVVVENIAPELVSALVRGLFRA
jgi:3-dehydroquinate synthase